MMKHNENGKIERWIGEIIPTDKTEEKWLKWFTGLTAQERAEVVVLGREMLARKWQQQADIVVG